MKRLLVFAVAAMLMLITSAFSVQAQDNGRISGTVINPDPFVGVRVELSGSASRTSTTDSLGAFDFVNLPAGCYELQAFPPSVGTYQISEQIDLNLSPGQNRTGVVIALDGNAYRVTGTVKEGTKLLQGVSIAFENGEKNIYLTTQTNSLGVYTFTNLPPGEARVSVQPFGLLGSAGIIVELLGASTTVDFGLGPEARVTGRLVNDQNQFLAGVSVVYLGPYGVELQVATDGNGYFTITNLPAGIGELAVDFGSTDPYCKPARLAVYLSAGGYKDVGTIRVERCALVQGTALVSNPDHGCDQNVSVNGLKFEADGDINSGVYRLRLPEGTHDIYLDGSGDGPWELTARPVQVTVTAANVTSGQTVSVPQPLVIYSDLTPGRATVSGEVVKVGTRPDPHAYTDSVVGLFLPGKLNDMTAEKLASIDRVQQYILPGFGNFSMRPVPPGIYDACWILYTETPDGKIAALTLRGFQSNVNIPTDDSVNLPVFTYASEGSPVVSGVVRDITGNPVLKATVLITDSNGFFAAFAETDRNGYWEVYNLPSGNFTATASSPFLSPAPGQSSRVFNADEGSNTSVDPLLLNPAAITPLGILNEEEMGYLTPAERSEIYQLTGPDLVAKGLESIRNKEVLKAKAYFKVAVSKYESDSSNTAQTAWFFRALTRVSALAFDSAPDQVEDGLQDIGDILDRAGYSTDPAQRDPFNYKNLNRPTTLAPTSPRGAEIQQFAYTVVFPEVIAAIGDLDKVFQSFNASWVEPLDSTLVESDYGDVLAFRAALKAAIGGILIQYAHNLDADIAREYNAYYGSDPHGNSIEAFLANNTNFGAVTSLTVLQSSKPYLDAAAADALSAIEWIQAETDPQSDDYISLRNATPEDISDARNKLVAFKQSLYGQATIDDRKTPSDTSDDTIIDSRVLFTGLDLRRLLPAFIGNQAIGFLPDPTFAGALIKVKGNAPSKLNEDLDNDRTADVFHLEPANAGYGWISGVVTAQGGGPLQGVQVWALGVGFQDTGIRASAVTNAGGSYTLYNVPTGTYRIMAVGNTGYYTSQFYNSSQSLEDATVVNVVAGGVISGISFALGGNGGKISGTVTQTSDGAAVNYPYIIARDANGKWMGRSTSQPGTPNYYTIDGLPPGNYYLEISQGSYQKEYYNNAYTRAGATPVTVTAGTTKTNIDFGLETKFSIEGYIQNSRNADGTYETIIEAQLLNYTGTLPGDITSITVTGPGGTVASYPGAGWQYVPVWTEFMLTLPGSPTEGLYTFTARTAGGAAIDTDYQYINRQLPFFDETKISPANNSVLSSKTPSFTWNPITYAGEPDIAIYYRLEIWDDAANSRVFATGFVHGMTYYTIPPAVSAQLVSGRTYKWRVRAADGPDAYKTQNRVLSNWRNFTVASPLSHANPPAIVADNFVATTWNTSSGPNMLVSVRVVDMDGVSTENLTGSTYGAAGVSHTGIVTFPGGTTADLIFGSKVDSTSAYFEVVVPGVPPSGTYTVTITDPDGKQGTISDEVNVNLLSPPDPESITPNNLTEYITAQFDNVYVNGSLYDDFDSYTSFNQFGGRWSYSSGVTLVDNSVVMALKNSQTRVNANISLNNPSDARSMQADITVRSTSANTKHRARLVGNWFNDGRGEIWGGVQVRGDRVYWAIEEDFLNNQNTWEYIPIPGGDLLTGLSPGQTIRASVSWNESAKQLTFSAQVLPSGPSNSATYTHTGPAYPSSNPYKALETRIHLTTSTTPTFSWDPVPGANRYRFRVYNYDNSRTIWNGYTEGAETSYTMPPGLLKPNSQYRFRLEARDAKNPLDVDNNSKTPASNNDNYIFYTDSVQATRPSIDPDGSGVRTWTSSTGRVLSVWCIVGDAQGVPGNIRSVKLLHPSNAVEELIHYPDDPYGVQTATSGAYRLTSSLYPAANGTYTITVEDREGNTAQWSESLDVNPIDYPLNLSPANGAVLGGTGGTFSWDPVTGAAIYRLEIWDYGLLKRLYSFDTTTNQFSIPPGLLREATTYRYRVQTRRELFADNVDNQSVAPALLKNAIVFSTTAPTDTDGDGMPDYWEDANGLDRGVNDASLHSDGDGLTNLQEFQNATNPKNADTDGDGFNDDAELAAGKDPLDSEDFPSVLPDSDGDGFSDLQEVQAGTDPNNANEFPSITALYVSAGGSDLNLGTAALPLKTLHKAVARANASPETSITINLGPGTYNLSSEAADTPVVINRNITINGSSAILNGTGAAGWASGLTLAVGAENVTLNGLTIQNFKQGLAIQSDGGCITLTNVTISSCETGIELAEAYQLDLDLSTSVVTGCGIGVKVTAGSSNTTVRNGEVRQSTGDGIRVERSNQTPDGVRLKDIVVDSNAGNGIVLYDGAGHSVTGCTVTGNNTGRSAYAGIAVFSPCTVVIQNLIQGNNCLGLYADDRLATSPVDAHSNDWGSTTGPSGSGFGSGDGVSENVLYTPWTGSTLTADADNDGWSNLAEEQAGTNPFDANSRPAITEFFVSLAGDDNNSGDSEHPLRTLHRAVRRVNDLPGVIIYAIRLTKGIYTLGTEGVDVPVNLTQNVTIYGNGSTLDGVGTHNGTDPWKAGLTITAGAERVILNNLTIRNFDEGIQVVSDGGCVSLNNVHITGCKSGLSIIGTFQTDIDLHDSVITNCETGVRLCAGTSNTILRNGTVQDNLGNGILLMDDCGRNQIIGCTITGNNIGGAAQGGVAVFAGSTEIHKCLIYQNRCYGVYAADSLSTALVEASDNWWGSDSGPSGAGPGTGDRVGEYVIFEPWSGYTDAPGGPSQTVQDMDGDGLPDWWETVHYGSTTAVNDPTTDADGDGLSLAEEALANTNPNVGVEVFITTPASNPLISGVGTTTIQLQGTSINAAAIAIQHNGLVLQTLTSGLSSWSYTVPVVAGKNLITATASADLRISSASVTVIIDNELPTFSIVSPAAGDIYSTALSVVSLSGVASDNTGLAKLSWSCGSYSGTADGTTSWSTSLIPLNPGDNLVTVTAEDNFGNSRSRSLTIRREDQVAGVVVTVQGDLSSEGAPLPIDPLDRDGDGYVNSDETACGSNPELSNSVPNNFLGSYYPTNPNDPNFDETKVKKDGKGNIIGSYLWPDCKNPDDDRDGLPDTWELKYFGSATSSALPSGNPDSDGYTNIEELLNGTDPTVAQVPGFTLTIQPADGTGTFDGWLPGYKKVLKVTATWTGGGSAPTQAWFRLLETSSFPGRAVNDPDPAFTVTSYPSGFNYYGPDFGLSDINPPSNSTVHYYEQGPVAVTGTSGTYTIYLQCLDFGGRTRIVVGDSQTNPTKVAEEWIPKGSKNNGIGAAWDFDNNPTTPNPIAVGDLAAAADIDALIFQNQKQYSASVGDGFNNFEEYRGILYTPFVGGPLTHMRLNPLRKDLFVRAQGYDDARGDLYRPFDPARATAPDYYPFRIGQALKNAGVDVHNTTEWGHDATVDPLNEGGSNSFFMYHRQGSISAISANRYQVTGSGTNWAAKWPLLEWEFKLKGDPDTAWTPVIYWAGPTSLSLARPYVRVSSGEYAIRTSLPHINVLIVRLDRQAQAAFSMEDGHISFMASKEPGPDNPTGSRHWDWSTKGVSQVPNVVGNNYGIATSLKNPLDRYFNDKPYSKGPIWENGGWRAPTPQDKTLAPLRECEDFEDSGTFIDGYFDPNLGILLGNAANGKWDGDQRLKTVAEWEVSGRLNPFDIDSNGQVELPTATDPKADNNAKQFATYENGTWKNPYTKAWVLVHTTTHEIIHVLADGRHSEDPSCLMYTFSNNWKRADHLSDWYRSLLRVHNEVR